MLKKLKPSIPYILACLFGIASSIPSAYGILYTSFSLFEITIHILSFVAVMFGYIVFHSLQSKLQSLKILTKCLLFFLVALFSMLLPYAVFWMIDTSSNPLIPQLIYCFLPYSVVFLLLYCVCTTGCSLFLYFLYKKMVDTPTGKLPSRKADKLCSILLLIGLLGLLLSFFTEWFNISFIGFFGGLPYYLIIPIAMLLLLPYSQALYGFPKKTVLWYDLKFILAIFSVEWIPFSNYLFYKFIQQVALNIERQSSLYPKYFIEDWTPSVIVIVGNMLLAIFLSAALFLGISAVISMIRRKSENGWTSEKDQAL